MIYNKRKAGRRHDWGVVVLVLGSFSLPPLLYFRYILVYLYYSKKKNIHCTSPALSSPALLSLVMLCHCCCGCCFRAVVLSVAVERWALSLEAMLKGGDVVVDVDVDVVCCLHYMLFVCCWPPDKIASTLWQLLIGLFLALAPDLCSLLPTVSTHISLFPLIFLKIFATIKLI